MLNAIGNLQLSGAYTEALKKLGYDLEAVAEQVVSHSFLSFPFELDSLVNLSILFIESKAS